MNNKEYMKETLDYVLAVRKEIKKAEDIRRKAKEDYKYEPRRFANLDELASFFEEGEKKGARLRDAENNIQLWNRELERTLERVKSFLLPHCSVEYTADDRTRYLVRHQRDQYGKRKSAIHFIKQEA